MAVYIEAWLDHPALGCGMRRFVDLTGPRQKQRVLFYWPTLTTVKIDPRQVAAESPVILTKAEARHLRGAIRRIAREHLARGWRTPSKAIREALARLAD